MMPWLRSLALLTTFAAASCSKPDPPPERTEPWPAQPPPAAVEAVVERYRVAGPSEVQVLLKSGKNRLEGRVATVQGELEVDLVDLERSRGRIRVDVGSILFGADSDDGESRRVTADARNWLDLGASQPPAELARKRWAEFEITEISQASVSAPHEGRRRGPAGGVRPGAPDPSSGNAGSGAGAAGEVREVDLVAVGNVTFHGFRVEHSTKLRARFHYDVPATPGAVPVRIEVETRSPMLVPLAAHDVKPRDSQGTFVAAGMKLLGKEVARDARVSVVIVASVVGGSVVGDSRVR